MFKFKKVLAMGLIVSTFVMGSLPVSASSINLHYTYGAPSSDQAIVDYCDYVSHSRTGAHLNISTFNVNYTAPYMTLSTDPSLNFSSVNETCQRYIQYKNGVASSGGYVPCTATLNNYGAQRTVTVYGSIYEG